MDSLSAFEKQLIASFEQVGELSLRELMSRYSYEDPSQLAEAVRLLENRGFICSFITLNKGEAYRLAVCSGKQAKGYFDKKLESSFPILYQAMVAAKTSSKTATSLSASEKIKFIAMSCDQP